MAITQPRFQPRTQRTDAGARANRHTNKEARRILKRHLSDVIYQRMIRDLAAADHASRSAQPPPRCTTARAAARSQRSPDRPSGHEPRSDIPLTAPRRAPHSPTRNELSTPQHLSPDIGAFVRLPNG
jgi:hypothetical protein